MALNPAFVQQTTRTLPFCVGYVYAQGDKVASIIGPDGATCEMYVLADGEWTAPVYLAVSPGDVFQTAAEAALGPAGELGYISRKFYPEALYQWPLYYHFHGGSLATKGIPNNLISIGPDQGTENWLTSSSNSRIAL